MTTATADDIERPFPADEVAEAYADSARALIGEVRRTFPDAEQVLDTDTIKARVQVRAGRFTFWRDARSGCLHAAQDCNGRTFWARVDGSEIGWQGVP